MNTTPTLSVMKNANADKKKHICLPEHRPNLQFAEDVKPAVMIQISAPKLDLNQKQLQEHNLARKIQSTSNIKRSK